MDGKTGVSPVLYISVKTAVPAAQLRNVGGTPAATESVRPRVCSGKNRRLLKIETE